MEISAAIANKVVSHVFFFFYILVVSFRIMCRQLLYLLICYGILAIDCPSSPFIENWSVVINPSTPRSD